MPGKVHRKKDDDGCNEFGYELGPFGIRKYNNRFGWGISVWIGKLYVDLAWDK